MNLSPYNLKYSLIGSLYLSLETSAAILRLKFLIEAEIPDTCCSEVTKSFILTTVRKYFVLCQVFDWASRDTIKPRK